MKTDSLTKSISAIPVVLATLMIIVAGGAAAHGQKVKGVINGRSGATMTLQTADSPKLVVLLTPTTQVEEVEGALKARKKQMAMTSLIPGLPVEVEGSTNNQGQLVADSVKFKGNDLKAAMDAQAGLQPTVEAQKADQAADQQALAARSKRSSARKIRRLPRIRQPLLPPTRALANWVNITLWAKSPFCLETAKLLLRSNTNLNYQSWLSRH